MLKTPPPPKLQEKKTPIRFHVVPSHGFTPNKSNFSPLKRSKGDLWKYVFPKAPGGAVTTNKSAEQRCRLRFQDVDAAAAFYSCHREATVLNRDMCICVKKCNDIPASLLR